MNKAALLLALLLALPGCGQDENASQDIAEAAPSHRADAGHPVDAPVPAAQIALVGRAEYMRGLLAGCVNHDYPELEAAQRESFCDCFHTATYAGMSDAEWVEWDAMMVEKGKIWGAGFERVFGLTLDAVAGKTEGKSDGKPKAKPEPLATPPDLQERLDRFDADWQQRYTRNENACMKKLGVTVKLTHQP
ncbi:hypothetical protein AGMMS49545_13520 [Betaproteobacteria bacterium]|nr:hypothetical protein AGMMS49545_13520 [Betaproteobacteria bacterium]GHU47365.1 hypothetical protein AGMMS50289_22450 [Betaproteobacteria bacterium]